MNYKEDVAYLVRPKETSNYIVSYLIAYYDSAFQYEEGGEAIPYWSVNDFFTTVEQFEEEYTVIGECSEIESIVKQYGIRANKKGTYIKEGYREWGM